MTSDEALAWADQTMNERLREARRTGNDHDYDAVMEGCIDILAAEVRRLREENAVYEPAAKNWPALLARCEAAEGCDGNCSCVVMSRHEWQRAYSEERLKREAAEAEVERLREARADDVALVARLSHQVVALRGAITRVLDGPHYIDRDYQDVLLAALKGEGR
jgi:acyl-coenzyme A thioesterase PaaI-like protein